VNAEHADSESQIATLPVRLSRDFRLSVPSTTGSVRRDDFSLYAGAFVAGSTILFPFCLIKSVEERMPLPTLGKPYLNRQEEMSWGSLSSSGTLVRVSIFSSCPSMTLSYSGEGHHSPFSNNR